MAYDFEEQEKLEAVKAWWAQYGNLVITVVTACVLTIAAFQGWRYYHQQQALSAAALYEQLMQAERAGDPRKVRDIAAQITGRYGSTPYAAMGALSAALASFDTGEIADARTRLQWVIDNAREQEVRDVARLRLAGVLLDEKNYTEALALLDGKHLETLGGRYADLKGDILSAQGKMADARNAYQQALEKSDPRSPYRAMIQAKLDALGDAR
jgi:predicted negative regulator of RcsB-dependent stress response